MDFHFRPFKEDLQNENLINEFKGNLFEFQVAQLLATEAGSQQDFLNSVPPAFLTQLKSYQSYLLNHRPILLTQLSDHSKKVLETLSTQSWFLKIERVRLVGKILSSEKTEADIILEGDGVKIPLSLKYTKKHAWLNTKSGGIKSFYKYFDFADFSKRQRELTQLTEIEFEKLARELHLNHGLEYDGSFDQWRDHGLTELPGQLEGDDREALLCYYQANCEKIFKDFCYWLNHHPQGFQNSLWALLGFQDPEVVQVICFVDGEKSQIKVIAKDQLAASDKLELKRTDSSTSFELQTSSFRLQIRVKPMNKFTVAGLKMNCSVKHLA